jgi:hypothetical protein
MAFFGLEMSEDEFEYLHHTSMLWGSHWKKQKNRFDPEPAFSWKMAYWVDRFADALIMREWLRAQNHKVEIVWDNALNNHLLLTDYKTEGWKNDDQ